MWRPIRVVPAAAILFALVSCTDDPGSHVPSAPAMDVTGATALSQGASLQLRAISDAIDALEDAGLLNAGLVQGLRARVASATRLFDSGMLNQGRAILSTIRLQVAGLVSGGGLTADQAAPLAAAVNNALAGGLSLVSVTSGELHTCGLTVDGQAWCWGYNHYGQLGDGTTTNRNIPTPVVTDLRFVSLRAGGLHTCGLIPDGSAYCWGHGDLGELGNGTKSGSTLPVRVSGDLTWTEVDASFYLSCALASDGTAHCWGSNQEAALGIATATEACVFGTLSTPCSSTPVSVSGNLHFRSISTGLLSSCGLDAAGNAHCWGWGSFGELGDGVRNGCETDPGFRCAASPTTVLGGPFASISAGGAFACGLTDTGTALCWGFGEFGQLGNGTKTLSYVPTMVAGGLSFSVVTATKANSILGHACGLMPTGKAYCWGSNAYGQLGTTSAPDACPFPSLSPACSLTPHPVDGDIAFSHISPGNGFTCGVDAGRGVWCWGRNESGEIGDGTNVSRPTPTRVLAP